jgi:hypothetical protein
MCRRIGYRLGLIAFLFVITQYSWAQTHLTPMCPPSSDPTYPRMAVLDSLRSRLYRVDSLYAMNNPWGYVVTDEQLYNFFVQDLTDTSNYTPNATGRCIQFNEGHVYYFSAMDRTYYTANFCVPMCGRLLYFGPTNCRVRQDDIEDVIRFSFSPGSSAIEREALASRIRQHARYSRAISIDGMSTPICE